MLLLLRPVEHDLAFGLGQLTERHVRAHAELPDDVGLHIEPERAPWDHRPLVDAQRLVGDQGGVVHIANDAGALAARACTGGVERQVLRARTHEGGTALRADDVEIGRHRQRRRTVMAIRTAVAGQAGEHQPQHVQQFGHRAEGRAHAARTRTLVQRQRRRQVADRVDLRTTRLGHAAARVGGQRIQIPARPFRIQHVQRQRGLARTGHTGDADQGVQRDVHVHIPQIVHASAAHLHRVRTSTHRMLLSPFPTPIVTVPDAHGLRRTSSRSWPRPAICRAIWHHSRVGLPYVGVSAPPVGGWPRTARG